MKKLLSFFLIVSNILNFSFTFNVFAVDTNNQNNPWTIEKAEHLARKSFIWVTQDKILQLYNAWSANNAVDILFPDVLWPDKTSYNQILYDLKNSSWFSYTWSNSMYKLYQAKYYFDPYETKRKLFMVFEDIFAVNPWSNWITYSDIDTLHELLYSETLGNYKTMIKKVLYNNWNPWDFAISRFLDLLNQTNKNNPNENYARELMQLFLMDEYKPLESLDLWNTRNYEETDVASLAKILFWYKFDESSINHTVYYQAPTFSWSDKTDVVFLTWSLKSWDSFSFYNESSWSINLPSIQTNVTENSINYIFSKREEAISLFLANKFYKFYVSENPTKDELNLLANQIRQNNFEILPSIKWLLKSDMMYSSKSMNELKVKNPIELAIWWLKILNQNNINYQEPTIYFTDLLTNLWWTPYSQNSIFWRDWFDKNENFYNANLQNKWISYLSKIVYSNVSKESSFYNIIQNKTIKLQFTDYLNLNPDDFSWKVIYWSWTISYSWSSNIQSKNFNFAKFIKEPLSLEINWWLIKFSTWDLLFSTWEVNFSTWIFTSSWVDYPIINSNLKLKEELTLENSISIDDMITMYEDKILLWKRLDSNTKNLIKNFLSKDENWNDIIFEILWNKEKIESLWIIFMSLPEFVLNWWFTNQTISYNETSFLNSTSSKIVFVELSWGYDYINNFFAKKNKLDLQTLRPTLYRKDSEIVDLWDYYMENHLAYWTGGNVWFKSLFDTDNLKIFNRVWAKNHSRDHDQASKEVQSCDSFTSTNVDWSFGKFIKTENPDNTIVIWNSKPYVFRNGKYINIWASWNQFYNNKFSWLKKEQILSAIKNIADLKVYPESSSSIFRSATKIDEIWNLWKSIIWKDWAWWDNIANFEFVKMLMENNLWKAFYIHWDGWYDTHDKEALSLDYNINKVISSVSSFFRNVENTQDVTIVIYSEFGRTIKENGWWWTDHWKAWAMWVVTNNNNLKSLLTSKIYWELDVIKEKEDFLWVWIYYDSVYAKIIQWLYNKTWIYTHLLEDDLSLGSPLVYNFSEEVKTNWSNNNYWLEFFIDSKNFDITSAWNVSIKYWNSFSNLNNSINMWDLQYASNKVVNWNKVKFSKFLSWTWFAYEVKINDNQYNEKIFTWYIVAPSRTWSYSLIQNKDTLFTNFNNKLVNGEEILQNKIILWNTWSWELEKILTKWNWINIKIWTWSTFVDKLSWSWVWNGRFVLWDEIDKSNIFSSWAITSSWELLKNLWVSKIIKIWADTLGISMKLNREVDIELTNLWTWKYYKVLSSDDLVNWTYLPSFMTDLDWKWSFKTNHFSYFALIDMTDSTPDQFVFTDLLNQELNTHVFSNEILISWINLPILLTLNSWEFSINSWSWNTWTYLLNNWDKLKLKAITSSDYSSFVNLSLELWWISDTWSITTKQAPIINWWWWGWWGGGWWWVRILKKDTCPEWDYSNSYYDNTCWVKKFLDTNSWTIIKTEINLNTWKLSIINDEKINDNVIKEEINSKLILKMIDKNFKEVSYKSNLWVFKSRKLLNKKFILIDDSWKYVNKVFKNNLEILRYLKNINKKTDISTLKTIEKVDISPNVNYSFESTYISNKWVKYISKKNKEWIYELYILWENSIIKTFTKKMDILKYIKNK